jgi:hypothetical protein
MLIISIERSIFFFFFFLMMMTMISESTKFITSAMIIFMIKLIDLSHNILCKDNYSKISHYKVKALSVDLRHVSQMGYNEIA